MYHFVCRYWFMTHEEMGSSVKTLEAGIKANMPLFAPRKRRSWRAHCDVVDLPVPCLGWLIWNLLCISSPTMLGSATPASHQMHHCTTRVVSDLHTACCRVCLSTSTLAPASHPFSAHAVARSAQQPDIASPPVRAISYQSA